MKAWPLSTSATGRFVVYPPSHQTAMYSAAGSRSTCSNSVSTLTPVQCVSSLVHFVTQWMSTTKDCAGSLRKSSHVHVMGSRTRPSTVNVQRSRGVWGVGPAERTGKSRTTCWPGGTRCGASVCCRFPRNPREMNGTCMLLLLCAAVCAHSEDEPSVNAIAEDLALFLVIHIVVERPAAVRALPRALRTDHDPDLARSPAYGSG